MRCIRCQETEAEDWYNAGQFAKELSSEGIEYARDDDLCLGCGCRYIDISNEEARARIAREAEDRKKRDGSQPVPLRSLTYLQETWCTFPGDLPLKLSGEQKKEMFRRIQTVIDEYIAIGGKI